MAASAAAVLHTPRWARYEPRRLSLSQRHTSAATLFPHVPVYQVSIPHTVLRMQLDKEVTKGPVRDALDVRLPVCRSAGEARSRKLGQRVEVDIVGHCVEHVGQQDSERRR